MNYTLPDLTYAYDALEPYFDKETMNIHHLRHHEGYINNLNIALAKSNIEETDLEEILKNISEYPIAIRNNAGGHYNHSLFWKILSPTPKLAPEGDLADLIKKTFGGFDEFKIDFKQTAIGHFGSGWTWLILTKDKELVITSTANQDNPLMDIIFREQGIPLLGLDIWEHAYYLKYQNKRTVFIDAFWSVLDWETVEKNYETALKN